VDEESEREQGGVDPDADEQLADELDAELNEEFEDAFDADEEFDPLSIDNPDVIATARRRYGNAGAALGAGMFGLDQALTGKQKPESVQIQEAASDPVNVDRDGIVVKVDDSMSVNSPALERRPPVGVNKKKSRR
jgi:hypothetical protein